MAELIELSQIPHRFPPEPANYENCFRAVTCAQASLATALRYAGRSDRPSSLKQSNNTLVSAATSAQLGKSLNGPEWIRAMPLQFWPHDKFPATVIRSRRDWLWLCRSPFRAARIYLNMSVSISLLSYDNQ
jgi:hypothetical protein